MKYHHKVKKVTILCQKSIHVVWHWKDTSKICIRNVLMDLLLSITVSLPTSRRPISLGSMPYFSRREVTTVKLKMQELAFNRRNQEIWSASLSTINFQHQSPITAKYIKLALIWYIQGHINSRAKRLQKIINITAKLNALLCNATS